MFDMIEYYHSATRLNISYNKIGLRGWQACSRMLKKVQNTILKQVTGMVMSVLSNTVDAV